MFTVISTSLNPNSRSRLLANAAYEQLQEKCKNRDDAIASPSWIDLREFELPICDGDACYGQAGVAELGEIVSNSAGILLASPVYNYDVSASAKNLIELTGQAWTDKVVGLLLAAGGQGSYMSGMGLANSLMLDFRSLILPRFVYGGPEVFSDEGISDPGILQRIDELTSRLIKIASALSD